MRTPRDPQWTPRQREVLDLLVRGKTNSEIAGALGISLDGAKWHVSEIITRLGVDSRDEAAEYWRQYNGLRMRFTRIASGLFSSGTLKWSMGTAFVVGVVAASAMVIYALRDTGGEESDRSGGVQNPDVATPVPTPPGNPTPAPTPVATPPPTGEVIAGVSVSRMTYGTPGSLPVPLSVIVEKGCYQCDGPASSYERVTLDQQGALKVEELFKPATGYIAADYFDPNGATHYLSVCSRGYCGGVGVPTADAQSTIYRSTDGGVTWQAVETFDGFVSVAAITSQGALINRTEYVAAGVADYKYQVLGTSTIIRPPAGMEPATAGNRLIGWVAADQRTVVGLDGSPLVTLPDIPRQGPYPVRIAAMLGGKDFLISWIDQTHPTQRTQYLGYLKDGKLEKIFTGPSSLDVGSWLNQGIAFGNVLASPSDLDPASSDSRMKLHPAMVDLNTGEVTILELYGQAFSDAYDFQRNRIQLVEPGPFVRVTGAGDCLNVREQPSTTAPVIACYADNVLLRNLNTEQVAGGITWWKVRTPSGRDGWASKEFLAGSQPQQ